jgi:hypothetical protein
MENCEKIEGADAFKLGWGYLFKLNNSCRGLSKGSVPFRKLWEAIFIFFSDFLAKSFS